MLANKGVIYARYSSDLQDDGNSIEAQLRDCYKYAQEKDIQIIKEYIDEAKSGKTDNRQDFQNMISDAQRKLFNFVIVHKVDRFGRSREDSVVYKSKLKKVGIKVLYSAQHLDDSPEGRFMEGMLESMAQYYSDNLATEVMKGMKTLAYKAKFTGGIPPLGYNIQDGNYVVSEQEVEIVRTIFKLYSTGNSYRKIIEYCKDKNYKTKAGNSFGNNSLYELLKNKKYIGIYEFNKAPTREYGKRNFHGRKSDDQIIRLDDAVPKIIDTETWQKVQIMMERNKRFMAQNNAIKPYLLTGLIYCSCGATMNGKTNTNNDKVKYSYYACSAKCGAKMIRKDIIENKVFEELYSLYFSDEGVKTIVTMLNESIARMSQDSAIAKRKYEESLKTVDAEINNIVNAIASGIISEALTLKLSELEASKNTLIIEQVQYESSAKQKQFSEEYVKNYINKHKHHVFNKDIGECKSFIHLYIDKAKVDNDNIIIDFKLDSLCVGINGAGGRT
ncbi:MAG: recombinase family protein [Ruminiclostridium sp.]